MTLSDILKESKFSFPIKRDPKTQIKEFIENKLDDYQKEIDGSVDLLKGLNISSYHYQDINAYKDAIKIIITALKETVANYFEGKTSLSYFIFTAMVQHLGLANFFKTETYPQYSSFYRIRNKESNYPLDIHDLFHIPFDKLEKISTQRFSIPGYPALYVGNSLFVCWEELNRPNTQHIQCAILRNVTDIKILDVDWTGYWESNTKDVISEKDLLDFGILWPLLACFNIKVPYEYKDDSFKGEYIFPQLFLQYIRSNYKYFDGIRYSSSKTHHDITYSKNRFHNIVLPVQSFKSSGYCDYLKSTFVVSDVQTWNLNDFTNTVDRMARIVNSKYFNKEVEAVCMYNNGNFIDYKNTRFWEAEAFLDGIPISDLKKISK